MAAGGDGGRTSRAAAQAGSPQLGRDLREKLSFV